MENSIQPNDLISVIPDQVSCDLANETVILALKEGVYYGFKRSWNSYLAINPIPDISDTNS